MPGDGDTDDDTAGEDTLLACTELSANLTVIVY